MARKTHKEYFQDRANQPIRGPGRIYVIQVKATLETFRAVNYTLEEALSRLRLKLDEVWYTESVCRRDQAQLLHIYKRPSSLPPVTVPHPESE